MKSSSILLNGIVHRVYRWGSPKLPKLFFLHGWLDTGASFDFVSASLEKKFHCIAIDLRGYGKSAWSKNKLGYFFYEYVADLHALVEKISPKDPVRLVGHSLGGAVTTVFSGTFPERVSHLANVEGFRIPERHPEIAPGRVRSWIEAQGKERFRSFPTLKEFASRLRQSNPKLPEDRALFLARHLGKRGKDGWTMAADPQHKLTEPYLMSPEVYEAFWGKILAKTLFVSADETEKTGRFGELDLPNTVRHDPKKLPPGTRKEIIADCGHMVHHERPEVLGKILASFLSE